MGFGDEVARRGWRTGSVVPEALLARLQPHLARSGEVPAQVTADDWLAIVSQTCDIVAPKREAEPWAEALLCRRVPGKPRKGRRDLRSTRYLDFRPNRETHPGLVLNAHAIADRYLIPRDVLADNAPDPARHLDRTASARVLAWYALRAGRPAWPECFCARIHDAAAVLEDTLGLLADDIAEVRVAIKEKDQELAERAPYHVVVFFVVDEDVWDSNIEGRAAIHTAFAAFVAALQGCAGVEVDKRLSDVVSGGNFTWQDMQQTDLWNFANLSQPD